MGGLEGGAEEGLPPPAEVAGKLGHGVLRSGQG